MPRHEEVPYVPTKADEQFLKVASEFRFIRVGDTILSLKYLSQKLGTTNYYTLKKWRYRLTHIPNDLPYGDITTSSAAEHLKVIAQDILKLDDAVNTPFSEDSEYLNPDATPKFVPDPKRAEEVDGIYNYDQKFTDEELKNFVPFPGSE